MIAIGVSLVSLVLTIKLYFDGTGWLLPALLSYAGFAAIVWHGNRLLYLVPYPRDDARDSTDWATGWPRPRSARTPAMAKIGWLAVPLLALLLPNLLWLSTSTLRIQNDSGAALADLSYSACGKTHALDPLPAAAATFVFLEACGDDSLEIGVGDARFCQMYVEGDMYHVGASVESPQQVRCEYGDLLSNLFIAEALF